ncbi:MAG: hypothetical protein WBV90_11005 [Terrimicrobiaceae bacterium]
MKRLFRLFLMPRRLSWWIWTITALCLAAGLSGHPDGFRAAIIVSMVQTGVYCLLEASASSFPVQVRLAYSGLLIACQVPFLSWLYWVPAVGTFALVLFGYCLMARILSLLPGNRTEPMSLDLIWRTFLTPPMRRNMLHGLPQPVVEEDFAFSKV